MQKLSEIFWDADKNKIRHGRSNLVSIGPEGPKYCVLGVIGKSIGMTDEEMMDGDIPYVRIFECEGVHEFDQALQAKYGVGIDQLNDYSEYRWTWAMFAKAAEYEKL
jgi:hypothetical protein